MPRQTSYTGAPDSSWRNTQVICSSLNFDFFIASPRAMAHAQKRPYSSFNCLTFLGPRQYAKRKGANAAPSNTCIQTECQGLMIVTAKRVRLVNVALPDASRMDHLPLATAFEQPPPAIM